MRPIGFSKPFYRVLIAVLQSARPGLAYQSVPPDLKLDEVFCFKYYRTVGPIMSSLSEPSGFKSIPAMEDKVIIEHG
jgi:hypothetical protein